MSFKDMLASDIQKVFLNDAEFAEKRTVRYDRKEYEEIPVLLIERTEQDRPPRDNPLQNAKGIFYVSADLYLSLKDMDGVIPKRGSIIELLNGHAVWKDYYDRYRVAKSSCSEGLIHLELEDFDE